MPPRRDHGRYRNPSVSAKLAASGLVGMGAVAASVLAPTAAHAATEVQWDRIAQCESGGNWHADTGNGYFGGLQFSASTWSSFDVDGYASQADQATREQQIDVANHVLSRQGWRAWPVCSKNAGTVGTVDHARGAHIKSAHQRAMAQMHKGSAKHVAAPKKAQSATRAKPAADSKAEQHYYVVRRGDTLSSIARAHDIKGGWRTLYRDNRAAIGPNPAHLHVGIRLAY
jgi:hypothetical protein